MNNKIILKEKYKRYAKRLRTMLQKFLKTSTASDMPYIERYIDAIGIMGIIDPGRLPFGTKDTSGTKRCAFFALLSRLLMAWWTYNTNPQIEAAFLVILKRVEKIDRYTTCNLQGNTKDGFELEVI